MTYDILLEGHNGERLVDFAGSDEVKDHKVKSYIKSFKGCSAQYDINKVVARSRKAGGPVEKHEIKK